MVRQLAIDLIREKLDDDDSGFNKPSLDVFVRVVEDDKGYVLQVGDFRKGLRLTKKRFAKKELAMAALKRTVLLEIL